MTTVAELHTQAMDCAEHALIADRRAEYAHAQSLFVQAFTLERNAAERLIDSPETEPTRSILLSSAASLALHCHEYREAERLVAIALVTEPPAVVGEELRRLVASIGFRRHLYERGVELDPSEVHLLLDGPSVGHGITLSKPFIRRTEISETLLLRTVERMKHVPFRTGKSPSRMTARDFETYLAAPLPGSFGITLRVGRPLQGGQHFLQGAGFVSPANAIDELMGCLSSFVDGDRERLAGRIEDTVYFENFVGLARRLAPDGKGITHVGLSSHVGTDEVQIEMNAPPSRVWTETAGEESDVFTIDGRINAADDRFSLKTPTIGVTDRENAKHRIYVPIGVLDDIVRPLWHEEVSVIVKRGVRKRLDLIDIEPASPRND